MRECHEVRLVLNAEQCVVLRDTFATRRRAGLDLTSTKCDHQVRDQRVFCLAGTVGDHDTPAVRLGELRTCIPTRIINFSHIVTNHLRLNGL